MSQAPQTDVPATNKWMKRDEALNLAVQLAQSGRLKDAENISTQLISRFPKEPDVVAAHSFVLHGLGQEDEAIKLLETLLRSNNALPVFHSNLCEMHRQKENLGKAMRHGKEALKQRPDYPEAHNNLGIVYFDNEELEQAEQHYREAIRLAPQFAEAHNNLGNVLRVQERMVDSLPAYEKAIELNPKYVEALTNAGKAYLAQGDAARADELFRRAIDVRGDYMDALTGLAAALHAQDNDEFAMSLLARLTTQFPTHVDPYLMITRLMMDDHKYSGAMQAAKQALELEPDNSKCMMNMGRLCREMGEMEEAVTWFQKALEVSEGSVEAINQLGSAYLELGELDKAREHFERALEKAPSALRVYTNLASAKKFTKDDAHYANFLKATEQMEAMSDRERCGVYYSLGKVYDDVGEHEKAIAAFAEGAKLKVAELNYNREGTLFLFDRVKEVFTKEAIDKRRKAYKGQSSDAPIFILGMPRSGSTLTEQIISSHSQVFGAGEIRALNQAMTEVITKDFPDTSRYPEIFGLLSNDNLDAIAEAYIRFVPLWKNSTPKFTDKMLTNFFYVGLLHLMLPNAKIIHIRRHPVDTCISCFTKLFREDLPYSYDFEHLTSYYKKYVELMQHWHDVLPKGAFMELKYEDLVTDTETKAKELIDFVGLEWEPQCLEFYKSKRAIKTASLTQVREPIYTRSIQRWKKYGAGVQPLVDMLADVNY